MYYLRLIIFIVLPAMYILISCSHTRPFKRPSPMDDLKNALIDGRDFRAEGVTFEGDLDFGDLFDNAEPRSIYINSEVRLKNCTFRGDIRGLEALGQRLYFNKEIYFEGCTFDGNVAINDAVYRAYFQAGGCLFRHSLDLQRSRFYTNCRIDDNEIGQDLIMQYSVFQDDLSLFGNKIGNHVLMQSISARGETQANNIELHGTLDMSNSFFHQNFYFDYAKGGKKVLLGNSTFSGKCQIRKIQGFDHVDLSGSRVMGRYEFSQVGEIEVNTDNLIRG